MNLSGDAAARLKKLSTESEKKKAKADARPVDLNELYALRARMLGVLLRDARTASGYAVEDVAAHLGVSPETVVEWEFGRQSPSLPQLELLAYFVQLPISHFWGSETLMVQHSRRAVDAREYAVLRTHMIGALVRARRETERLSLETLAGQVGITPELMQAYEMGQQPIPMTVLVSLASMLRVNLDYFLVDTGRVGEFFDLQEALKTLAAMPPAMREFVATPTNQAYLQLAMLLAQVPTENLRKFAESLLNKELQKFAEGLLDITL
jgi:transcriptional regulator with XRE-family HTH domain